MANAGPSSAFCQESIHLLMKNKRYIPTGMTRIAGSSYILIILIGIVKVGIIERSLLETNGHDLFQKISDHELLFRIGIASETAMYILVVVLSLSLFFILKTVNKNLAFSALAFRFGEAIIGVAVTILSGLMPLLIIGGESSQGNGQMRVILDSFLNVRTAGMNLVLIFIGIGGTLFFYLFHTSRFVPRILADWGIFTYASMFILGFINILLPARPLLIENVLFSLGAVFELIVGFWLLLKGVDTGRRDKLSSVIS